MKQPFILRYDKFGKDLVRKVNERFAGTLIEIPVLRDGIVPYVDIFRRAAIVTVLSEDTELRKTNILPITPIQSERFSQAEMLERTVYKDGTEELGLVFALGIKYEPGEVVHNYGIPSHPWNKVPQHSSDLEPLPRRLFESICKHSSEYGLTPTDLQQDLRVLIVNPGLEKNDETEFGVGFIIVPRVTEIHKPASLYQKEQEGEAGYGTMWDAGLPFPKQDRAFYISRNNYYRLGGLFRCARYEVRPKVGPGELGPKIFIDSSLRIIEKAHQGCPKINFSYPLKVQLEACQEEFGDVLELRMNCADPHIMHLARKGYMNRPPLSDRLKQFRLQAPRLLKECLENLYYPAP